MLDLIPINFVIKLLVAGSLGGLIGVERKLSNKSAGLRTMILISVGCAVFVDLAIYIVQNPALYGRGDLSRTVGHIIAGIGFLGAGTIMRVTGANNAKFIEGLTTSASIWCVAGIGLLSGLELYPQAVVATIFIGTTLFLFRRVERKVIRTVKSIRKKK